MANLNRHNNLFSIIKNTLLLIVAVFFYASCNQGEQTQNLLLYLPSTTDNSRAGEDYTQVARIFMFRDDSQLLIDGENFLNLTYTDDEPVLLEDLPAARNYQLKLQTGTQMTNTFKVYHYGTSAEFDVIPGEITTVKIIIDYSDFAHSYFDQAVTAIGTANNLLISPEITDLDSISMILSNGNIYLEGDPSYGNSFSTFSLLQPQNLTPTELNTTLAYPENNITSVKLFYLRNNYDGIFNFTPAGFLKGSSGIAFIELNAADQTAAYDMREFGYAFEQNPISMTAISINYEGAICRYIVYNSDKYFISRADNSNTPIDQYEIWNEYNPTQTLKEVTAAVRFIFFLTNSGLYAYTLDGYEFDIFYTDSGTDAINNQLAVSNVFIDSNKITLPDSATAYMLSDLTNTNYDDYSNKRIFFFTDKGVYFFDTLEYDTIVYGDYASDNTSSTLPTLIEKITQTAGKTYTAYAKTENAISTNMIAMLTPDGNIEIYEYNMQLQGGPELTAVDRQPLLVRTLTPFEGLPGTVSGMFFTQDPENSVTENTEVLQIAGTEGVVSIRIAYQSKEIISGGDAFP
jgi:hypothetical protein